ncbi:MAG: transglycosylase SLT domain-containing protein [Deltaproteobacteria bacterium]|nr:transglycosylase SLT domain-containing protein [Deltaproteobacteria bacterium]MDQ3299299.1 transglycosylase SLT domain-containing protein [Myxococcota bacterium]
MHGPATRATHARIDRVAILAVARVAVAVLAVSGLTRATAQAHPAADLGDAYRAYDAAELGTARAKLAGLDEKALANRDYLYWLRGMIALRSGDPAAARADFEKLGKLAGSRFSREVPWRLADCAWAKGDRAGAAKAYAKLVAAAGAGDVADVGTARYRIAETATGKAAPAAFRSFVIAHPAHPLAASAERKLGELGAPPLTAEERIERAKQLTAAHLWDESIVELSLLGGPQSTGIARARDYWLGKTLFKMRRRYGDAGKLLLAVYPEMGDSAAEAMFHGARALSRADRDDEAIIWYRKVVDAYPKTAYGEEAQFLSGWLQFNRGKYREAIAPLEETLQRYPRSKWVDDALWFLGMSHYFLGEWQPARKRLDTLARSGRALEGGKGMYWLARIDEKLAAKDAAIAGYLSTIKRFPFSWYALLARSRLAAIGVKTTPFGIDAPAPRGPKLAETVDEALAKDDLIARADELIAAGLTADAGLELARGERGFLKRHDRATAFAMLLDRYRKAGNFNRPWMLAISYSGNALHGPADGDARRWWIHAYPRAYQALIEKHQHLGSNPDGYLYSIMRKESGFDPHVLSYADAQGLLQMIPATTRRVAKELAIPYDAGRLYEPEYNIQTASWYIGRMLGKFKGQIPIGAGSFNSGPRPVMRWLELYGDREMDEFVELVPYTQTREYMKKVTENFARYRYLYQGEVYEQPLTVDKHYVVNRLTY